MRITRSSLLIACSALSTFCAALPLSRARLRSPRPSHTYSVVPITGEGPSSTKAATSSCTSCTQEPATVIKTITKTSKPSGVTQHVTDTIVVTATPSGRTQTVTRTAVSIIDISPHATTQTAIRYTTIYETPAPESTSNTYISTSSVPALSSTSTPSGLPSVISTSKVTQVSDSPGSSIASSSSALSTSEAELTLSATPAKPTYSVSVSMSTDPHAPSAPSTRSSSVLESVSIPTESSFRPSLSTAYSSITTFSTITVSQPTMVSGGSSSSSKSHDDGMWHTTYPPWNGTFAH